MTELAPLGLGPLVTSRRIESGGYTVTLAGFPTFAAAERRVAELRARGIDDVSVVDLGRGQYVVALGIFRTESAANARADALAQQGITGTRVAARAAGVQQSVLVLRDPPQSAVARVRELAPAYAGTDIRVGGCERSS
jgi:hypothetical protein